MKSIILVFILLSLTFINGCSLIGFGLGSIAKQTSSIDKEHVKQIDPNQEMVITFKNNETISGHYAYYRNGKIHLIGRRPDFGVQTVNYYYEQLPGINVMYYISEERIRNIAIVKGNYGIVFGAIGLAVDILFLSSATVSTGIDLDIDGQ